MVILMRTEMSMKRTSTKVLMKKMRVKLRLKRIETEIKKRFTIRRKTNRLLISYCLSTTMYCFAESILTPRILDSFFFI